MTAARKNFLITFFMAIAVFVAAAVPYLSTINNPLVWDDKYLITENSFIKDSANIRLLFTREYFSQKIELSYRPLGTLALFAGQAAGGGKPITFRIFSITLHSLNSVLLFILLMTLFSASIKCKRPGISAFAAAVVFAVHPLNTEVINGVTFNEDLLCLFFILLSLICYIVFNGKRIVLALITSLFFFALSLLSKETAIVLPAVIVVYELLLQPRGISPHSKHRRIIAVIFSFGTISAAYLLLRFVILKNPSEHIIYHGSGAFATFMLTCQAWMKYLLLAFVPLKQCVDYFPASIPHISDPTVILSIAGSLLLILLFFIISRRYKPAAFFLAWFVLFLLPVSNIIPIGVVMAERYMYIPLAGLAAGVFCSPLLFPSQTDASNNIRGYMPHIALILVVPLLASLSAKRNNVWISETAFWSDACKCAPESAMPRVNLGVALFESGRFNEAEDAFKDAIRIASPRAPENDRYANLVRARGNLGMTYAAEGRHADAISQLELALSTSPDYSPAMFNLASIYLNSNAVFNPGKAVKLLESGLAIDPGNSQARLMLVFAYELTGNKVAANEQYKLLCASNRQLCETLKVKKMETNPGRPTGGI